MTELHPQPLRLFLVGIDAILEPLALQHCFIPLRRHALLIDPSHASDKPATSPPAADHTIFSDFQFLELLDFHLLFQFDEIAVLYHIAEHTSYLTSKAEAPGLYGLNCKRH